MIVQGIIRWLVFSIPLAGLPYLVTALEPGQVEAILFTNAWSPAVAEKAAVLFQQLPSPTIHYASFPEVEANRRLQAEAAYEKFLREKVQERWFAALVGTESEELFSIHARFETWRGLVEFLGERNALVEVWARGEAGKQARRVPATKLDELKRQRHEPPTSITVTYQDPATGKAATYNLEFGFQVAAFVWAANQAYQKHRLLSLSARDILGARNAKGLPDATAQWDALQVAVNQRNFSILDVPARPKEPQDVFVAFEFEVDEQNNFLKAVNIYRDSEIRKRIVGEAQVLFLQKADEKIARQIQGFRREGLSDQLQPAPNPILGQDVVELRVRDPAQPDPKKWHVVEFGEPELLKQSALAHFSLLNAYLERHRKARAMTQANLALIAEPIIAGLNIGGGLAGLGFPAGEPARLLYNLITWRLISEVPTVKQMRELFAVMAARERNAQIKLKPEHLLSQGDIQALKEAGSKLSDREVQTYLEQMTDEDIRAMLRLARMGMFDARVTTFLNILTSAFKISGVAYESGPIRELFNNVRFSMNGDINLKTLLMLAIGKRVMTPLSGVSLETLSRGQGPQEAWLQYLEVSVDIRAVINTLVRLMKRTEAKKELEKPFPYAPRVSELAAYEVRVFGFPLLLFYKRGLIKADEAAYEHDYAYGLRGVRLIEHFHTREEMEAEIRAGRMFPLGLVRVPSTKGGWKETDLVVYAHRIPNGRYRGKTALIIYGLKAYVEHSELIAREILRFKEFEKGLHEGAVIEQWIRDNANSSSPARAFEPVIHAGSNAVHQVYNPLLGNLLELRRHRLRKTWGLPVDEAELKQISRELTARDVQPGDNDPLVAIDPYSSSFIYRRQIAGREQSVKVTNIPGLADIGREMQKAEDAKWIEETRREAAAGKSAGVVLLNEVVETDGPIELGALLRNARGELAGAGITSGARAIEEIFELVNRLPITDRARLRGNHFAATVVELDRDGKGKEKIFLTIEFPLGELRQEWRNPLTGEREILLYKNGLWRKTITDRRILEIEYDAAKVEISSRTYLNQGNRQAPVRGVVLEESRTFNYWYRDLSQPDLNPYQPIIAKLRINYVTGQLARETYGLFVLPVETADDQYVTRNRYTPYGIFESADVYENGREESDFLRPPAKRVLEPIAGRARFHLASHPADNAVLRDLSSTGYVTVVDRTDLVKGLTQKETFDNARFGRKTGESCLDPFDGTPSFSSVVEWDYRDDFHLGLVPVRAINLSSPSGTRLSEVTTIAYDPLQRRMVGREVTYTGKAQTNTWDYRYANPVEVETAQRRITQEYNRDETVALRTTSVKATGEVISQSSELFDTIGKTWHVVRQSWYQPGVLDHIETNTYSAYGKLISTRIGNFLEARPTYTAEGIEQSSQTFQPNAVSGDYDVLCRQEDDYHWQNGEREAHVQLYVAGSLCDDYRMRSDAEGRTLEEGIRKWPPLELKAIRTYDGATERVLKAEVLQNGEVRATHQTLGVIKRPEGDWSLRVKVSPFLGLAYTNSYLLGDPLGRVTEAEFENGERARVTAWFAGTALAETSELLDRHGRVKERFHKRSNGGDAAGLPYDIITRYKVSPWGEAALIDEQAVVRGTEVPLFCERPDERIYFDLSKLYQSPLYGVDPHGHFGIWVSIQGTARSNVTAIFTNQIRDRPDLANTNTPMERVLELTSLDLHGFFYHACFTRTFDRAGSLLEESVGKIRNLGPQTYSDQALLAAVAQATYFAKTIHRYEAGWVQEKADGNTGQTMLAFTTRPATNSGNWSVNDAGWREWSTEVNSYRASTESLPTKIERASYLFRRLHSPRMLKENRYLPGVTNVWVAWSGLDLNDVGKTLFESENIFDAQGELSTLVAHKRNSQGRPANKIVYQLPRPPPEAWRIISAPGARNNPRFNLSGPQDLSACDFVAFYLDRPASGSVRVQVQDVFKHSVLITKDAKPSDARTLSFWPVGPEQVKWLPNEILPERGSVVTAARTPLEENRVFAVSIPELARTGLAVSRVASIDLLVPESEPASMKTTPLYRLQSGEPVLSSETPHSFTYDSQPHSSGLELYLRRRTQLTTHERLTDQGWNSLLTYQRGVVASLNPRFQPPHYPILLLTDNSDPDSRRPLYSLAAEDGKFLEYYQTVCSGDTRVYTIVNGFDTPKLEVFRASVLDDEISPGILAFGHGYYVTLPLAKASGGLSGVVARLHNRCVASAFALAGENLLGSILDVGGMPTELRQLAWQHSTAASQAREINQLPTLAEVLLATRQIPWAEAARTRPVAVTLESRRKALRDLTQLSLFYITNTRLIPTSPGTEVERYVDTVQEAAIIELAVKLHNPGLAKELMAFYWEKSQGGANPVLASYDAKTGASLEKQTRYQRPSNAAVTARAQLAMAEAAICLGTATSDTNALEFGRNLVQLVLARFRPDASEGAWPRGIAENVVKPTTKWRGLWPEANTFSVASNGRAYLLFTRLAEQSSPFEPAWKRTILEVAREQAAWLTNRIAPYVQARGVVPKGLFEVQDVHNQTTALAIERWTTTDDWLTFIEAADRIGVSREITRAWLDNLARSHGVTVKRLWGLDWTIPVQRPDAISPELTAKFRRVANLLDYHAAADLAQHSLDQLRQDDTWPAALTTATTNAPLKTGQGLAVYPTEQKFQQKTQKGALGGWPATLGVYTELLDSAWPTNLLRGSSMEIRLSPARDITRFFWTAAGFYLTIVAVALFWWSLSFARRQRRAKAKPGAVPGLLVPEQVMQKAEERWAKCVLGLSRPAGAEHSRYSNGAIEQNFQTQLRAIYKLTLEWRRVVNGWSEGDARLAEDGSDEWLNGLDEFSAMVGIYTRWVIKAGRKDGLPKEDVLQENEDSNHIWSRLVMYFSESHLRLLKLMKDFKASPAAAAVLGLNDQIELVLRTMGARARPTPFDARLAFDAPSGAAALDLLLIQLPGASLAQIVDELERKLEIPREHVVSFIKGYKSFKARELLFPIHPYVLEAAKILPHFILMGLVGLIWYNNQLGGLKIYPYLRESLAGMALDLHSLIWALPLFVGFGLSVVAHYLRIYRYRWGTGSPAGSAMALDADLTSWFGRATDVATPALRTGRRWNPLVYQWAGWVFRAVGLGLLAVALFQLESPSFATFMCAKMLLGLLLLAESASLLGPIFVSHLSAWLEDHVSANSKSWSLLRFINQLNLVPTRPASLIWLSIKYHFQPSVPTGGALPMLQAIAFYLVFGAAFFFVGSYMFKQALEVWFQETYQNGWDLGLVLGTLLFWNTMYLLRFGLFVLFAAVASAAAVYPLKVAGGFAALACFGLQVFNDSFSRYLNQHLVTLGAAALIGLILIAFESELLAWLRNRPWWRRRKKAPVEKQKSALRQPRLEPNRALAVVYMSGDELSFHKLTPELLMARVKILRDQLGSGGMQLLSRMQSFPDDTSLAQWFWSLYELEKKHDVTLWHPMQLVIAGEQPRLREELGLNHRLENASQRQHLEAAWHLRRWLVTMMSTQGHSQDTGINLVDIALRLAREDLAANAVFYMIQNKYDNDQHNRPSQLSYTKGELGQRNKLARLLMELAPGSRAYSINDWTPFGFKAGGLVGMDLVYEESLKLANMLVLDRNANAHDLEAVMADLRLALNDPGVVIVIPGRSTTNTLTPIGQSSQLIEEGHRALTRGVMMLGGNGSETLGTGWGNIQAIYYGRVQRALCDANTSIMPLTTSAQRGATFGDRCEGLIGFGPHAIGISEDIWAVTQAAHNALGLGYQVKFQRSQALWHKIRECWSHAEWLSAFPRWSGGYLQMMLDPIMQQINDAGPLSVFAKEIRASGGRFFLSAPFALLSILLMPLAIIWDVSPFVQILILLWNLGLVMNQVLTALGLVACLESTGFNRGTALVGTTGGAVLAAIVPGLGAFVLPLLVLGSLTGGFSLGLGRWLYYRGRDVMLFGPQLVIHALGQVVRQSLEFVLSGASANDAKGVNMAFRTWVGPREDQPFVSYQNFVNLRTVVWGVGLVSLLLNLFALAHLDFLNVLLLLPSLMFSTSTLVGPFLMQPRPGKHLGRAVWAPKLLGWIASCAFYMLVARLFSRGGWYGWLGLCLCLFCFGRVLAAGMKYLGYSRRLQKLTARLAQLMVTDGLSVDEAQRLAQNIVRSPRGDMEKIKATLRKTSLTEERQRLVVAVVQERLMPLLKRPVADLQDYRSRSQRFICEWSRSFVLGLFTFIWFFLVPMPGLLVFAAPDHYRISLSLAGLFTLAIVVVGGVLAAGCFSLLVEWWTKYRPTGNGLITCIEAQYRSFQSLRDLGNLTATQTSLLYAMFIDVQTYFDQRSYAYARCALRLIDQTLKAAAEPKQPPIHLA